MDDLSQYKDLYLSEVEDLLQKLNDGLLTLEKEGSNKDLLNELMRSAHTIKGSSATMGYDNIAFLTHVLEDVFDGARNDKLKLEAEVISVIFEAFDALKGAIQSVKNDGKETDLTEISEKIKGLTGVKTVGTGKSTTGEVPEVKEEASEVKPEVKEEVKEEGAGADNIAFVKVPVSRLDNLMGLTEELLTCKMQMDSLVSKGECGVEGSEKLKPISEHLDRLVSNLQYSVLQVRLVPLEQIFMRFPRMVRDLAKKQGKEIEFQVEGGDLELDRSIIDKLAEPIVHLLRNAVDHGISEKGNIKLSAKSEKDFAKVIIEDDGKGIDWGGVVEKALEKGIITSDEAESYRKDLTNDKVQNLIFNPQLSTTEVVTETSGRGVGMDAVQAFMDEVGGNIEVESPANEAGGTRITLELPLTLAIIRVLIVKVGKETFAIPFSNIEKTVTVADSDVKSVGGQDVAIVDGTDVPLVHLKAAFHEKAKPSTGTKTVVLVKRGKSVAGVVVDKLMTEQEITVKPLPSVLKGVKGFSGSTILGDGRTILIIDIVGLINSLKK
jgi:two-component system, chemotaxis family, sensor kinase CheA